MAAASILDIDILVLKLYRHDLAETLGKIEIFGSFYKSTVGKLRKAMK